MLGGVTPMSEGGGEDGAGEKALLTRTPTHTNFLDKQVQSKPPNGTVPTKRDAGRKTFAFWTLVTSLTVLAVGNLLLTFVILGVLRIGKGMESIQLLDEGAVQLLGRVELEHVYKRDGLLEGWRDRPVRVESEGGAVLVNLQTRQNQPETKLRVSRSGISMRGVNYLRVRDHDGKEVFHSDSRHMHLPGGAKNLAAQLISTKRIASPIDEDLTIKSDSTIHLRGAEGLRMESKELLWSADQDIYLKSINGSIILSAKEGVYIDVKDIPIATHLKEKGQTTGQFKVCVCMPQGKLFRIAVPNGQKTSCSHVNMTGDHNPCI